jgi:hypothetical protein
MQGAGYWLNPDTGKCVQVATTHDEWMRDKANAESLGLPKSAYDKIMQQPVTAVDEIRMVALHWGLVRIREHPRYVSVQFTAHPHRVTPILRAVVVALTDVKVHPDTTLKIDNLLLNDSVSIGLSNLKSHLANAQPVLREQRDEIHDVPMDHPLPDEIKRQFRENP